LLIVTTVMLALQKPTKPAKPVVQKPTVVAQAPAVKESAKEPAVSDAWVSNVNNRLDTLEKNTKLWSHRLWVLAVTNNENTNMMRQRDGQDYIVFDREWKLNHMPRTLKLSPDEANMLKSDLK
jgi:hypothetical protein